MRILSPYILLFFLSSFCLFSQEETKIFLLNKEEYRHLETKNLLVTQAIKNAFGESTKQNPYKLDIRQVDAWNDEVKEFRYFPTTDGDAKRSSVRAAIIGARENVNIFLRVTLNMDKSRVNDAIKPYLNKKNAVVFNVVIIGDARIFVKETKDKSDFLELVDEQQFAKRAFRTFFGDPKQTNYNIVHEKLSACFVKNILDPRCIEKLELMGENNKYEDFSNKVTSADYSASYVLFDLPVIREKSTFSPEVEKALVKRKNGSEHIRFYYVIPKDNLRARRMTVEGKIVNADRKPVKELTVYLKDAANQVLSTQKTDANGAYKFEKLIEGMNYSLFIDNSVKETALFITTKNDVTIAELQKTDLGFEYKLLAADISKLAGLTETDPSMEFLNSLKGKMVRVSDKIYPIKDQVVTLKDHANLILQTQKTDMLGNFEFKNVNPSQVQSFDLPGYVATEKSEKIYMANANGDLISEFRKDQNNVFVFKILPADITTLRYMNETDVELEFKGQKGNVIIVRDFIYFDLNSAQISPDSKPTLDKVARILSENPAYMLEIISHTDSRGEDADNQKLSEKRSEAVMNYIAGKKADKSRLKILGMGESKPLNNCVDGVDCVEDEYKMNRRTEFRFYK